MNTGNIGNRNIHLFHDVNVDLNTIKNKNIQSFYGTAVMSKELEQFHNSIYGRTPRGPYGVLQLKGYYVRGGFVGFDASAAKADQIYLNSSSKNIPAAHNRGVRRKLYDGLKKTLNPRLTLKETIGYDSGTGTRQEKRVGTYRPLGKGLRNPEDEGTATKDAQRFLREAKKTLLGDGNESKPLRTHAAAKLMTEATRLAYTPEMKFRRNFPMAHRFAKNFILGLCPRKLSLSNMKNMQQSHELLGMTLRNSNDEPIGTWAARSYVLVDVKPLTDSGLQNQNGQLCVLAKLEDFSAANKKGKAIPTDKLKYVSVIPTKVQEENKEVLELEDVTDQMQNKRENILLHSANRANLKKVKTQQKPQQKPLMNANQGNRRPNHGGERTIHGVRCKYVEQGMSERPSGWYSVKTNELVSAE